MKNLWLGAAVVVAGVLISNPYHLQVLTFIGIYTLLTLGLNMLMGYAGQISLGHAAFYGLGAYSTGILTVHFGWSPWLTLPVSILLTAAVAYLVALPILKLHGYYLGMGTLGFGMIVFIFFREWSGYTGGDSGLVGIPSLAVGQVNLSSRTAYFFLVWGTVLAGFEVCRRIVNSRVGRALRAIHDSEQAAAAMGIDTSRIKVHVFVLSAVFAAVAGFLTAAGAATESGDLRFFVGGERSSRCTGSDAGVHPAHLGMRNGTKPLSASCLASRQASRDSHI